jgi:NADH-ubiquinone oxidoreductase chain 2
MVLSAALDNGYIFLALVAILTSVIGAVYYLNIIKEIFFYPSEHEKDTLHNYVGQHVFISSPFSFTISIITLIILLFIFLNKE